MSADQGHPGGDPGDTYAGDLASAEAGRVLAALRRLADSAPRRPVAPVTMPTPDDVVAAFPVPLEEEVAETYIRAVYDYPLFEPPPGPSGRHAAALDVALLCGPGQLPYDVGMAIRADDAAPQVVSDIMGHLLARDVEIDGDERELEALEQVLDMLLDSRATHAAVINGLLRWAGRARYERVIGSLLDHFNPAERSELDRALDRS